MGEEYNDARYYALQTKVEIFITDTVLIINYYNKGRKVDIKTVVILVNLLATAVVGIFMKFLYSELKQRDIKIDHLDERLKDVEINYNDKFNKVYLKQDTMIDSLTEIKVGLGEVKTMVKDQKDFCSFVQESKRK